MRPEACPELWKRRMGNLVGGTECAKGICLQWYSGKERKEKNLGGKDRDWVRERGQRKWGSGGDRPVDHCDDFAFYLSAMWL